MGDRVGDDAARLGEQFAERWAVCQVKPQGNRIQKISQERLRLELFATRGREGGDDHVRLFCVAVAEGDEAREQHHEQSGGLFSREKIETLTQLLRKREG